MEKRLDLQMSFVRFGRTRFEVTLTLFALQPIDISWSANTK